MKQLISLLFLMIFAAHVFSQNQITPTVTSSTGGESDDARLSWTFGETMILTVPDDDSQPFITQGFHQSYLLDVDVQNVLLEKWGIKIFPNPTAQYLNIKKDFSENLHYELHDLLGRKILKGELQNQTTQLHLQHIPNENYILSFYNEAGQVVQTVQISKINP